MTHVRTDEETEAILQEARALAAVIKKSIAAHLPTVGAEALTIALLSVAYSLTKSTMGIREGRQFIRDCVQNMGAGDEDA